MADVEIEVRGTVLLPGAHRVIRTLDPTEGPFAGTLVTCGDGVAVRVDASALAGWVGWRFGGAEHVAGPVDVVRCADGHSALLPWCTDQVLGFLVRRATVGSLLSAGERGTLMVSMLRGLDEVGDGAVGAQTGVWWLTDGGRPTFVIGAGEDGRAAAAKIAERLLEGCGDKAMGRVLTAVQQGLMKALTQPRVPRRLLEAWERELLAIAAPRPLVREVFGPERARDVARAAVEVDRRPSLTRQMRRADRRPAAVDVRKRRRVTVAGTALLAVAETVRERIRGRRDAMRARMQKTSASGLATASTPDAPGRSPRRRRALILAAAAAAAVLAGGLLWPADGSGESADAARGNSSSGHSADAIETGATEEPTADAAEDVSAEEGVPAPQTPPAAGNGPDVAATALLTVIAECRAAQDPVCPEAVAAGSVGVVETLATIPEGAPIVTLVDEYGDVAVVRLSSPGGASGEEDREPTSGPDQMLVLVRQDEEWLVRDVYGVADQPG